MKRKYSYKSGNKTVEREYSYIPFRYIVAILLSVIEVAAIIATVITLCYFVPYFYIAAFITAAVCVIRIIASDDNPEYKAPWLLVVVILPVAGFMLYLMFYSRKLKRKLIKRREELQNFGGEHDDSYVLSELRSVDPVAHGHAMLLRGSADTHAYKGTAVRYFPLGEDMYNDMIPDLLAAKRFIFMEYFIIEEGVFWNSILDVLKEKARSGVDVKVMFDDIGCMTTLPGNYAKQLRSFGIDAAVFSRLRGAADSEFNNRNHRKITVIDGKIGYTGGINLADEYIGKRIRFGHWKDTAVRLEGGAVRELTRLFLVDFGLCRETSAPNDEVLFPDCIASADGYTVPFGDGPKPIYQRRVGKELIKAMLSSATERVLISTPYLVPGDDLLLEIESAALRGVDVRIIVPHIPDKRLVLELTRSYYKRLVAAGVKVYEYTPGFIHAKLCAVDGKYATVSTVNLDHRSLAHHFENGVWLAHTDCIGEIEKDLYGVIKQSELITEETLKVSIPRRILRQAVRIFAPLM